MTLREIFEFIRTKKCLSRIELAEKLGVTYSSMYAYENYERTPKPKTIRKLIEIGSEMGLDLKPEQFFKL